MKESDKRTYRFLGWLALLHALICLLGLCFFQAILNRPFFTLSWVGLTTLWFLWPIVLVLHRGRSWRRCVGFVLLSGLFFLPSLPVYIFRTAAPAFGLPDFVRMEPVSIWQYYRAWWAGRADAQKDIAAGVMAIEVYGFGAGAGNYNRILRERYHIQTRPVAGCIVNERILGHAAGYNEVSNAEIDRRVGRAQVEAAKTEGLTLDRAATQGREDYQRELARRFSIFPAISNVTLTSVHVFERAPHIDFRPLEPAAEEQLGQFVREVEEFVKEAVRKSTAPFELTVIARLGPSQPPQYQTVGSLGCPRDAYDKVWHGLPEKVTPRWEGKELSVELDFVIEAKRA